MNHQGFNTNRKITIHVFSNRKVKTLSLPIHRNKILSLFPATSATFLFAPMVFLQR